MAFNLVTIAHAILAVFVIIELGLTAYVVDATSTPWTNSPSSFSFMLFCSIWSILVLIYLALVPMFFNRLYHATVGLGILVVSTIFWFSGSIAIAAFIGVPNCGGNTLCGSSKAAVAFGFFIWAIFTGLSALEGMAFMRSPGHGAHADTTKPGHSFA